MQAGRLDQTQAAFGRIGGGPVGLPARIAILFCVLCAVACSRQCATGRLARDNVLLVTLDTTRADRLGCYGWTAARTPALDALARRGTLFENAVAQVPMTLPSHATLLTGRYPRELGIRLNGQAALTPEHPTLASAFKAHGYETAAFVAAFVLDSRFGLNRGFDVYDDEVGEGVLMRRADAVTDRALAWLRGVERRPFFVWVHYFDPHKPYDPPEAFRAIGKDAYDGEVAFVDSQILRILRWLEESGFADDTLVVVAGDHGESFGEHGEEGHAMFLYQTNLRVPLLLAHPRLRGRGAHVGETVELADVFPTVLDLFGWSPPRDLLSRSLAPALQGEALADRESYAESHYVRHTYGWAEQRSLTDRRFKYVSSTRPELFDLAADRGEAHNLAEARPDTAYRMRRALLARYGAMRPGRAATVALDEDARRRLTSLGYVSAEVSSPDDGELLTAGLPDPKGMLEVVEQLRLAEELRVQGEPNRALARLEAIAPRAPGSLRLRHLLAQSYLDAGRFEPALAAAEAALELDVGFPPALSIAGEALVGLGRVREGVERFRAAAALDRTQVRLLVELARKRVRAADLATAARLLEAALDLEPRQPAAHNELGLLREQGGELSAAIEQYERALQLDPTLSPARLNLALALASRGDADGAAGQLRDAVRSETANAGRFLERARAWAAAGRRQDARRAFEVALRLPALAAESSYELGALAATAGRVADASAELERALALAPAHAGALGALARIYVAKRRFSDLARIYRTAAAARPRDVGIGVNLALLLASCSDQAVRNGDEAVGLAERAASLSAGRADVLATLAAAYAEAGRPRDAAESARRAFELASGAGQTELARFLRAQIADYEAGKRYRDPRF